MTSLIEQSRVLRGANRNLIEETQARLAISWRVRSGWIGIRGAADTSASSGEAATPHWPLDELERLIRDKIKRRALLILMNGKYRAFPATGQPCTVCGQTITRGTECEVRGPRGSLYAHVVCHSIWHRESLALQRDRVSADGGE